MEKLVKFNKVYSLVEKKIKKKRLNAVSVLVSSALKTAMRTRGQACLGFNFHCR